MHELRPLQLSNVSAMEAPATAQPGYADVARTYLDNGWAPLPLPRGAKTAPPTGWTGAGGAWPTPDQVDEWAAQNPAGNVGLRLPGTVCGIDVDDYDGKGGGTTIAELEHDYGPLPATWKVTSRGNGTSGIRLYRIPDGTRLTDAPGPGIDIIQRHHRYVVAPPSIHPNGNRYRIYGPNGERALAPPHVDELPLLPTRWLNALQVRTHTPTPAQQPRTAHDDDSIAERVNREHDWHNVLLADGWTLDHHRGDESRWTRPGKTKGTSAVLHEPDGPFNVFTTDGTAGALQQPWARNDSGNCWSLSMFGYLAASRYHGDRSATARAYRQLANEVDAQLRTFRTSSTAAKAIDGDDQVDSDEDWGSVPLGELATQIRNGTLQPIVPELLAVNGALPLLYRGRINSLFGESGGGKTWVALAAIAEVLRSGGQALMVDYEDHARGAVERLILLGLDDDEIGRLDYRNPTTGLAAGITTVTGHYDLVVIDSTGEAMATGGVDSNSDGDVATWFTLAKAFTRLDGAPAVVVIDHVPKDSEAPKSYAIGSQRKRAAISGASYRVDTIRESAKGRNGKLKLTVAKDRPGTRPKGTVAAEIDVLSDADGVRLELHQSDAQAAAEHGERFRPTVLMERVSRYLETVPAASQRAVCRSVTGKDEGLRTALAVLVEEGYVNLTPMGYEHVQPFRGAVDNSGRVPASQARPSASRDAGLGVRPASSSPTGEDAVTPPPKATRDPLTASPVDNYTIDLDTLGGPF